MIAIISGELVGWCLFVLALALIISLAEAAHESLITGRRRKQTAKRIAKIVAPCFSDPKVQVPATRNPVVRGYDSPELFREDLWLSRIEQSRKQAALLQVSSRGLNPSVRSDEDYGKRFCAMLAQHAGARCDN